LTRRRKPFVLGDLFVHKHRPWRLPERAAPAVSHIVCELHVGPHLSVPGDDLRHARGLSYSNELRGIDGRNIPDPCRGPLHVGPRRAGTTCCTPSAISHLIDIGNATPPWVGAFDYVMIAVGLLVHAIAWWFSGDVARVIRP
jgi:hypothetical protein